MNRERLVTVIDFLFFNIAWSILLFFQIVPMFHFLSFCLVGHRCVTGVIGSVRYMYN